MTQMQSGYAGVMAALNSIPWENAPNITPIKEPRNYTTLNFFPGQCGFSGLSFPMNGVMLVANNFHCLKGWQTYTDGEDGTKTWRSLHKYILPSSDIPKDRYWFTNYCHGVKDHRSKKNPEKGDPCYGFTQKERQALEFERVFRECVTAMRPKVIVALGAYAESYLKFPRAEAITKDFGSCKPTVFSVAHPSANVSLETLREIGKRIGRAYRS